MGWDLGEVVWLAGYQWYDTLHFDESSAQTFYCKSKISRKTLESQHL
jgi:hypothetical protein